MFKKILAMGLTLVTAFCAVGCGSKSKLPEYAEKQFDISGFWAPYEITEESFQTYKDAGFTTLAMLNHSFDWTSEDQFYLGSERTQKALEICKKVGLNAILNYNDWIATGIEGDDYYGDTPFSKHDIYGDYKDIITGIHICDEPAKDHLSYYGDKTLVEDFKKTYPNAEFIANLIPMTALSTRGYTTYEEMMEIFEELFMSPFDNPYVSVDVYPFHEGSKEDDQTLAQNYRYIAESAKKYGVKPAYILQASVGGGEFEERLSESDLRWEINSALAFGADTLQYYCYSVPKTFNDDGTVDNMYDYCILNQDNTPSDIYYSLQKLHKEIQSYANVILSYDWDSSYAIEGTDDYTFRLSGILYDEKFEEVKLENDEYYVTSTATQDTLLSRFTSEKYGNAYMFVNYADRDNADTLNVTFKNCSSIAIYGGEGFDGTPEIVSLDENGNTTLQLKYGEGKFIVPLK